MSEGTLSWQFPAGEQEPGETPDDAAVRETREEVGLEVLPESTTGERIHPATRRRMIYVACSIVASARPREAEIVDTKELDASMWCPVAQVRAYLTAGAFQPVLEYLARRGDG